MATTVSGAGRLARHHLIGLAFWQAWQMVAFCSDAVIADAHLAGFSLKTVVIACTTLGYLVVMAASGPSEDAGRPCGRGVFHGGRVVRHDARALHLRPGT